jgi:hypothetical protein
MAEEKTDDKGTEDKGTEDKESAAKNMLKGMIKEGVTEGIAEYMKANQPKNRTNQPDRPGFFQSLFGQY